MRLPAGATICLDTSALLPAFAREEAAHRQSRELIDAIRVGRVRGAVSTVAAAEAVVRPLREQLHGRVLALQALLLTLPHLTLHPVTWQVAMRAGRIRAEHGIRLPDALIIASAMDCGTFASNDRRALAVAEAEGIDTLAMDRA